MFSKIHDLKIGIIGLGYVGLPLAVEFARHFSVVGYDIDAERINELKQGNDRTSEIDFLNLLDHHRLVFATEAEKLLDCNVFIVTVPTPVDSSKTPDLSALTEASKCIGELLKRGDFVIFESTVYPGVTEDICLPILEKHSGLRLNIDFGLGYSPERINPGDRERRLPDVCKVVAASSINGLNFIEEIYSLIVTAGVHRAPSIKVAEAAKVIENTQRDVNIALMNELAQIFSKMNIDTQSVLEAANTKWNFLPFKPGLVGGHCIGVDPYYLTTAAMQNDCYPELVLSGRRINEAMPAFLTAQILKMLTAAKIPPFEAKCLILGYSFKPNCPDTRNTKVFDLINELESYGVVVEVFDPLVNQRELSELVDTVVQQPLQGEYQLIILAVPHDCITELEVNGIRSFGAAQHVLVDVSGFFPKESSDLRL